MAKPSSQGADEISVPESQTTGHKWWQWAMLYPALGLALISAVPQWTDKALALYHSTNSRSYDDALNQGKMWRRNLSCASAPFAWYENPQQIRVDATICNSGDVFVRASTPQNTQFFKWISIDDVLEKTDSGDGLISQAKAEGLNALQRQITPFPQEFIRAQYQNAMVICQRFLDQRMLLRHVRTPQGCFDEIIDTFNGMITQRNPVPCRPQC